MNRERKRIVEVRLIVIVLVDVAAPSFAEALTASGSKLSTVAGVVAAEVVSNLESVSYVESVIASLL